MTAQEFHRRFWNGWGKEIPHMANKKLLTEIMRFRGLADWIMLKIAAPDARL